VAGHAEPDAAGAPTGPDLLKQIVPEVSIPVAAIGGITADAIKAKLISDSQ